MLPETIYIETKSNFAAQFHCCGAAGPRDYMHSHWYNRTMDSEGLFVPPSCCVPPLRATTVAARSVSLQGGQGGQGGSENRCQVDMLLHIRDPTLVSKHLRTKVGAQNYFLFL